MAVPGRPLIQRLFPIRRARVGRCAASADVMHLAGIHLAFMFAALGQEHRNGAQLGAVAARRPPGLLDATKSRPSCLGCCQNLVLSQTCSSDDLGEERANLRENL